MRTTTMLALGVAAMLVSGTWALAGPGATEMRFGDRAKNVARDREAPAYALAGMDNAQRSKVSVQPTIRGGRRALGRYLRSATD